MNVTTVLFDEAFYRSQVRGAISGTPWDHYVALGARQGIAPSPYFDVPWYRLTNDDLADFDGNIVEHWLKVGSKRHADPHPSFRSHWYWRTYISGTDVDQDADPLQHYATVGWKAGNRPNPLFWTDWYARTHLGEREGFADPFLHYLVEGARTCAPNPLFDPVHYLQSAEKPGSVAPDPLSHYIHVGWREGVATHPLFDARFYLRQQGLKLKQLEVPPLEHFLAQTSLDPHPVFATGFYSEQLRRRGIAPGEGHPVLTYLERGWSDPSDPHPFFSKRHYYEYSPDVAHSGVDALLHYLRGGWREGRSVHPLFDAPGYRAQHGEDTRPIEHYLTVGASAGAWPRSPEQPDTAPRSLPSSRIVLDVPSDKAWDKAVGSPKIGAFLHVFYPDLAEYLVTQTNNIPGDCTLYISTDSVAKRAQIEGICAELSVHPYEIRVTPNRGRDIAPMIVGFADRLREVDLGVHLHTKRSKHYAKEFEAWRNYLVESNVGSAELVTNILALLADDQIGMVAPEHYYPIRELIQWGGNFETARSLVAAMGDELYRDAVLDLPSGSMFWFKSDALRPLLDVGLTVDHFDPEAGQVDGTLAHAIERTFFTVGAIAGYDYAVINPTPAESARLLPRFRSNRYHATKRARGVSGDHYPETTAFAIRPSSAERPRINLLIPTVDTSVGYAGVASALDMYHAIREALGSSWDGRMIATDTSPSNQFVPPCGYEVRSSVDDDVDGQDVVIDAAQRFRSPTFVRAGDVFLSTAWWTAQNAFDIADQQAKLFGKAVQPTPYLIQDNENGFYAWSTKYVMCDATYREPDRTIPIFNTQLLADDFRERGYFETGHVFQPGINKRFLSKVDAGATKERLVLLYARPHAERNCLPFLDMLVETLHRDDPTFWSSWRFIAVGEDFEPGQLKGRHIDIQGRLSLDEYASLASKSALAVSLMVSPHPSYPPLEMAQAGVKVLANTYGAKDLADVHENISSFDRFHVPTVAARLATIAREWEASPQAGWQAQSKVNWFFDGATNLDQVAAAVADEINRRVVR